MSKFTKIWFPTGVCDKIKTGYISQTVKLGALGIPPYRTFSLVELEAATDNFENSLLLGQDSFGEVCQSSPLISSDSIEQEKFYGP